MSTLAHQSAHVLSMIDEMLQETVNGSYMPPGVRPLAPTIYGEQWLVSFKGYAAPAHAKPGLPPAPRASIVGKRAA